MMLKDCVETNVRCLESLGLEPKSYGPLLISVFMRKLPEELKLIISREFDKVVWDIRIIIDALKRELQGREKISFSLGENQQKDSDFHFSGSALHTAFQERKFNFKCAFCDKPQNSRTVTKTQARKDILKKTCRCFLCLKSGHIARNCDTKIKCFSCKGRHHVSVCNSNSQTDGRDQTRENELPETNVNVIGTSEVLKALKLNSVLLQTAQAQVFSVDEKRAGNFRILFDNGSQMTYISPRARSILTLKTICEKKMSIKTFGGSENEKTLDSVQFCIKAKNSGINTYVNAFVSEICHPLRSQ